jgi:LysM repeat protein
MGTTEDLVAWHKWSKYVTAATLMLLLTIISTIAAMGIAFADTKYTVQSGDTLSGIASRYGVTIDTLKAANALASSDIYAGQVLTIPSTTTNATAQPTSAPAGQTTTYVVQSGDSLSALAQRFGVTREALAAANKISPSSLLYVGQTLIVPAGAQVPPTATSKPATATPRPAAPTSAPAVATPQSASGTTTAAPVNSAATAEPGVPIKYTVQRGDSLSSIAYKFNTTVEALQAGNNLDDANSLEVGQVLTIVKSNMQSVPPDKPKPIEPQTPMGKLGPKWIELDLSTQMLVAYEGQTPVFSARMSSGLPRHPTVTGSYRIYLKYKTQRMRGMQGTAEAYDIPNVPNVMYFYSGYAIHGVWWHTNFGSPASHGCINLSQANAKWMYEWAPMGTMVVSHK